MTWLVKTNLTLWLPPTPLFSIQPCRPLGSTHFLITTSIINSWAESADPLEWAGLSHLTRWLPRCHPLIVSSLKQICKDNQVNECCLDSNFSMSLAWGCIPSCHTSPIVSRKSVFYAVFSWYLCLLSQSPSLLGWGLSSLLQALKSCQSNWLQRGLLLAALVTASRFTIPMLAFRWLSSPQLHQQTFCMTNINKTDKTNRGWFKRLEHRRPRPLILEAFWKTNVWCQPVVVGKRKTIFGATATLSRAHTNHDWRLVHSSKLCFMSCRSEYLVLP